MRVARSECAADELYAPVEVAEFGAQSAQCRGVRPEVCGRRRQGRRRDAVAVREHLVRLLEPRHSVE